ncbi:TetR/AcrR family transcriptional regulator [soil metagenome]
MSNGRPRSFDIDQALDSAMLLFWQQGYERTSLNDLTGAIGINRPSLYAAFGNKEELFYKALERYTELRDGPVVTALELPRVRDAVETILMYGARFFTDDAAHPAGCLTVQGALACSPDGQRVHEVLKEKRASGEAAFVRRFERARTDGDLPPDTDPVELARYVSTVSYGMAVQANAGATYNELVQVVQRTMRAWPE